jgi:hypothetical protein
MKICRDICFDTGNKLFTGVNDAVTKIIASAIVPGDKLTPAITSRYIFSSFP